MADRSAGTAIHARGSGSTNQAAMPARGRPAATAAAGRAPPRAAPSSRSGSAGMPRLPKAPTPAFEAARDRYARGARVHRSPLPASLGESALERKHRAQSGRHPLRALADRLPSYRRRPHRAVQLALRAPPRRQVPAAHRGYRQGALDPGGDRRDPRRDALARARLGRRDAFTSPNCAARHAEVAHAIARQRPRLSLLHDAGGARRDARRARRPSAQAVPHAQPAGATATRRADATRPSSSASRRRARARR